MHRLHPLRVLSLVCAVGLVACATDSIRLAAAPLHPRSFDGHWVVDTSRSENPDAATGGGSRGGMGGGHGHGGGMGGGGMGGGGMAGGGMGGGGMGGMGGGRHGGGGDGAGTRGDNAGGNGDMMRRALLLPNTLDIALQPTSLTITPDGHPRSVPMVTGKDSGDVTRAGWDGDSLVVVVHIDDKRGDIVQHYDLAPDRSRIVVTTEFRGNGKKKSIVREFTAATPGAVVAPEG